MQMKAWGNKNEDPDFSRAYDIVYALLGPFKYPSKKAN